MFEHPAAPSFSPSRDVSARARSMSRSARTIRSPRAASASLVASPIPLAPPVTIAVRIRGSTPMVEGPQRPGLPDWTPLASPKQQGVHWAQTPPAGQPRAIRQSRS
jgi:hypothetical protein